MTGSREKIDRATFSADPCMAVRGVFRPRWHKVKASPQTIFLSEKQRLDRRPILLQLSVTSCFFFDREGLGGAQPRPANGRCLSDGNSTKGYVPGHKYFYVHETQMSVTMKNTRVDADGEVQKQDEDVRVKMKYNVELEAMARTTVEGLPHTYFRLDIVGMSITREKVVTAATENQTTVQRSPQESYASASGSASAGLTSSLGSASDVIEEKMRSNKDMPSEEAQIRHMQGAFYYLQACDMEITKVFHPRDEEKSTINLKKGIATAFSHKLQTPDSASSVAAPYAAFVQTASGPQKMHWVHHRHEPA